MRLVLTGGGTGGHIYPALEVGREALERGAELHYFGSIRGQESRACDQAAIPFTGFPSAPLVGVKSSAGWKAMLGTFRSLGGALRALRQAMPDVVFSTGGYSAGPVVWASRRLRIPYVIHTVDSVPPKSSSIFARDARSFTCTFRSTQGFMKYREVVRTGQPIRRALREAAAMSPQARRPQVLVIGGSQGSEFLNRQVPEAAMELGRNVRFIHVAGPKNHQSLIARVAALGLSESYEVFSYLDADAMIAAYRSATVVVSRSGGTLAELALFGIPSVLVPLPRSANDHQLHNAEEFAAMDAATVLQQPGSRVTGLEIADAGQLARAISGWIDSPERCAASAVRLREWDVPNATERIVDQVMRA